MKNGLEILQTLAEDENLLYMNWKIQCLIEAKGLLYENDWNTLRDYLLKDDKELNKRLDIELEEINSQKEYDE